MTKKTFLFSLLIGIIPFFSARASWDESDPGYIHLTQDDQTLTPLYGVSSDLFEKIWQVWPPQDREKVSALPAAELKAAVFERYGLVPNPENPLLPLGFGKTASGKMGFNCAACHAGVILGQTVFGLPNRNVDFQLLLDETGKLYPQLKLPLNYAERLFGPEPGMINAWGEVSFALIFRDKNMDSTILPQMRGQMLNAVATPPAWWNVKYKTHLFVDGVYPKGERVFNSVAVSQFSSGDDFRAKSLPTSEILAFVEELDSPLFPGTVDNTRAQRGKTVFSQNCVSCHGTYDATVNYPNKMIPIDVVGTDPERAMNSDVSNFYEFLKQSWIGKENYDEYRTGDPSYVPPVLKGVWATAPYLHNGSVPTLEALLFPSERPTLWISSPSNSSYDLDRVGVEYQAVDESSLGTLSELGQRRLYDTRKTGRGNQGHMFGTDLSDDDKNSVIEYLKTL